MKRKQVNSDSFPMHWTLAISESEQVIWRNPRFYSHWRSPFFITASVNHWLAKKQPDASNITPRQ